MATRSFTNDLTSAVSLNWLTASAAGAASRFAPAAGWGLSQLTQAMKVTLDRTACAIRWVSERPLSSPEEWRRVATEIGAARRLYERCGWLNTPAAYHCTPPALLRPELTETRQRDVRFAHLRFESGYEPHHEEPGRARWLAHAANRIAHAWVFQHPGRPRPWLVCIHGYSMGFPLLDRLALSIPWLHHECGLNVILPVLPLHGPRRIGRFSGDRFFAGDWLDLIHAEAQAVWDLRRLVSWVRAQNACAVGVYGVSLGAYNAALLASLEDDLACVIAGIPATDFPRLARLHMPAAVRLAEQAGVDWDDVTLTTRVISPLRLKPRVPRAHRFIFGGLIDRIVPADQVKDLWRHWERPRMAWYRGGHLSFRWESAVSTLLHDAVEATLGSQDWRAAA